MNRIMRLNQAKTICPVCHVAYSDGHRHREGYRKEDEKGRLTFMKRCVRQNKRKADKSSKKGKPTSYSSGG